MRVLIAEDELIERKAMRKFIEENFSEIQVVGEAVNGRKAIEQAQLLSPNVIFMDVKMPGIDGLEAIKQIYNYDSSIKFIMISAYDSFDYAKQAMAYGIKDYILKPGKKEEIVKALLRVKKDIENDRQQQKERDRSKEWLKERFINGIMHHPLPKDTLQIKRKLYPEMKSGFFLVFMTDDNHDLHKIRIEIEKNIDHQFVLLDKENHLVVCMIANNVLEKDEVLAITQKIHFAIGENIFIGTGYSYKSLDKLQSSYHEAYEACIQLKSDKKRKYGFLKENNQTLEDIIADICESIEKGKGNEASLLYKENNSLFLSADRERLYIRIKKLFDNNHIVPPKSSILSLQTYNDWSNFINMCGIKINEFYQSKQPMMQVKMYLLDNYHQSISLEEVAATVKLSPNYFSSLFREEFGVTFIDYVTKIRMDKAKELIIKNNYSLKEISFMVGYKDPNYFSRVFKNHHKQSPKQYEKEILKK